MRTDERYIRDATPGGKTDDVDDWGTCCCPVPADTVASRSFSKTSTHPDRTGNTEL